MKLERIRGKLKAFKQIAEWENKSEILPFLTPNFKEEPHSPVNPYRLYKYRDSRNTYFIKVKDVAIGFVDYDINPDHLYDKSKHTAWPSICIGESEYWGKGYARAALICLEEEIWQRGFERIEIGVFGYNTKAKKLYESLGYTYVHVFLDFTYYDGEWHSDYRLEKLNPKLKRG